jgi:hypothetical protein
MLSIQRFARTERALSNHKGRSQVASVGDDLRPLSREKIAHARPIKSSAWVKRLETRFWAMILMQTPRSDFGIDRANVCDLSPTRGAIGRADRRSSQSVGSADDDDPPSPTSQHLRQRCARKAIQRMHHHIEHPAPVGVVDLISGPSIVPGHQVGDKNIDSSRGLH